MSSEKLATEVVKKPFLNLDLSFREKYLESQFRESTFGLKQQYLRFYLLCLIILFLLNWIINPLRLDNFRGLQLLTNLSNLIILSAFLMFSLCSKKIFKYPDLGFLALQIYICVGYVEANQNVISSLFTKNNFIASSTLLEVNMLVSLISRCSWKTSLVTSLVMNVHLTLRWANVFENYQQRGYSTMIYVGNFVIIVFSAYFLEKYERGIFHKRTNDEKTLQYFVYIMREVLPVSIVIYKGDKLFFSNEETFRLLGSEEAVEESIKEIKISKHRILNEPHCLSPESSALKNESLCNYLKNKRNFEKDRDFRRVSGAYQKYSPRGSREEGNFEKHTKLLEIKIGKLLWKGDDAVIAIISEDHASKRVRDLQEQAEYKDNLLATVSHDLRTPLNGVIGILDLVLESVAEKALRKSLQLALRSAHLLLFMINDILDFFQISKGVLRLNPSKFCVEEMIKDVSKLIKFQAKQKGLDFIIENKLPAGESLIFSDPYRIKQIILNLLGNAMKFTEAGFIKLTIETMENRVLTRGALPFVRFTVEDSGCGIRPEDIPKLFKLFGILRNEKSEKLNKKGIGLGLAISQNLARILNNFEPGEEITVRSEVGRGSCFSFPIQPYKEEKLTEVTSPPKGDEEDFCLFTNEEVSQREIIHKKDYKSNYLKLSWSVRKKILLVDDDQLNVLVLKKIFDCFTDCEYQIASNGKEAVAVVKKKASQNYFFDIIFMDINMPVMDGFEATEKILQMTLREEIPNVSIIASTANASQSDFDKCFKCGMVDFVSKPFTKKNLREKIDLFV